MNTPARAGRRVEACRAATGFTLIELMIVVAIVGLLGAIAYPSYTENVRRSNRSEAQRALLEAAQYMQRYYAANMAYDRPLGATSKPATQDTTVLPAGLRTVIVNGRTVYNISITTQQASFALTAAPAANSAMSSDRCGSLTLGSNGVRGVTSLPSGSTASWNDCWR